MRRGLVFGQFEYEAAWVGDYPTSLHEAYWSCWRDAHIFRSSDTVRASGMWARVLWRYRQLAGGALDLESV